MLFRPSFCAHCGERIDRPEWFPWTSRRFCQVCEIEFKGQDLIPRAIVGLGIIFGLFGIGGYIRSGAPTSDLQALKQPKRVVEQPSQAAKAPVPETLVSRPESYATVVTGQPEQSNVSSTLGKQNDPASLKSKPVANEPIYYCGAETKKGTPCTRRVKGNTRCFQHVGMPSMASEKLSVK